MSSGDISVDLEERTIVRKGLRKLRDAGQIPAVIHDHGKPSTHVAANYVAIMKVYAEAGKHHPVHLTVGGKKHLAMIKDVDFEPAKHKMRHVVFQAIKLGEKVEAEVPIEFDDVEIPAEKVSLMVLKQLDHVEVEALPNNLPDSIKVDPSSLVEVGDHLTVADLQVPEGVTILTDAAAQIAIVEMPRDQVAEADKAAEELAADAGTPDAEDATETEAPVAEDPSSSQPAE